MSSRVQWGRGVHTSLIGAGLEPGLEPRLGGRACGWVVGRLGVHPWLGARSHPPVVHGGSRVGGRRFTGWISFLHLDGGVAEAFLGKWPGAVTALELLSPVRNSENTAWLNSLERREGETKKGRRIS